MSAFFNVRISQSLVHKYLGYEPVYTRDGSSVTWNENANGFRLPTVDEWQYAARGGQSYRYAGSDNLGSVGWYNGNSGKISHPVAQKKPNGYGLYDMSGNVSEWCWDSLGGNGHWNIAYGRGDDRGFRIVRSTTN